MQNDNSNKIYSQTYTINSIDTWERKTISIPADTSGVINDDNGEGFQINFALIMGSTYTSGSGSTSWNDYGNSKYAAQHGVNIGHSISNNWYITGVQLEIGTEATVFEHRSAGEEFELCQRFYERLDGQAIAMTSGIAGFYNDTQEAMFMYHYRVQKRGTPTIEYSALSDFDVEPFDDAISNLTLFVADEKHMVLKSNGLPSETRGHACFLCLDQSGSHLAFTSEY